MNFRKTLKSLLGIMSGVLLLSGMAFAQTHPAKATLVRPQAAPAGAAGPNIGIAFNWINTNTANTVLCSTLSVSADCIAGDTLTDTTTGTVIAGVALLPFSQQSYTWLPAGGLYFGTHTFSLVTNYYGGTDGTTPLASPAVTVSVTNHLTNILGPTGLQGVPTP